MQTRTIAFLLGVVQIQQLPRLLSVTLLLGELLIPLVLLHFQRQHALSGAALLASCRYVSDYASRHASILLHYPADFSSSYGKDKRV